MSPVPGGMSMRRKSGSSQNTSARNCSSALCSIGPRQMTGLALGHEVADGDAAHAVVLRRHEHVVDHHRVAVGAEHAGDGVAVDVGVDDTDLVALAGERDGEVDGDAALADAALAAGDEQRAGLVARLVERHGLALGVTVAALPLAGPAGDGPPPCSLAAALARSSSVITREVERHSGDAGQRGDGAGDPVLDLVAQRAAGAR